MNYIDHKPQTLDEIKNMTKQEILNSDAVKEGYKFWLPDDVWSQGRVIDIGEHDEETVDVILDSLGKSYYINYISGKCLSMRQVIRDCIDNAEFCEDSLGQYLEQSGNAAFEFTQKFLEIYLISGSLAEDYSGHYDSINDMAKRLVASYGKLLSEPERNELEIWLKELLLTPEYEELIPMFSGRPY